MLSTYLVDSEHTFIHMEASVRFATKSDNPADLQLLLEQTHDEALQKNECATKHWIKLREEHVSVCSHLSSLPDKLSYDVMVPVGSKALMRGKMVHTNEILVCLGDGWFVKRSAKEAAEICDRRIKMCDNMLKDLERENNLLLTRKQLPVEQDAFGAESGEEVLEPCDEKKEAEWKVQHRQKEKEYRQKLRELHNKEKTKIEDVESLWKRLDELELQEELEEELDRLHAECKDVEHDDENSEVDTDDESETLEGDLTANLLLDQIGGRNGLIKQDNAVHEHTVLTEARGNSRPEAQNTGSVSQKPSTRRVSFADERGPKTSEDSDCESDSIAETLRIEFRHTPIDSQAQQSRKADEHPVQTPADIYKCIKERMSKEDLPKSILKNKLTDVEGSSAIGQRWMQWLSQPESVPIITQETEEPLWNMATQRPVEELEERPVAFGDVLEHSAGEPSPPERTTQTRPVSRFKAARLAAKR